MSADGFRGEDSVDPLGLPALACSVDGEEAFSFVFRGFVFNGWCGGVSEPLLSDLSLRNVELIPRLEVGVPVELTTMSTPAGNVDRVGALLDTLRSKAMGAHWLWIEYTAHEFSFPGFVVSVDSKQSISLVLNLLLSITTYL